MRELNLEPIQSLERAIQILNCFSFENTELSIDEIMQQTKLAKTTTYRLLWTLERNYLIQYNQKTNEYRLGTKLLEYGGIVLEHLDIRREAEPILLALHEETGHSVILAQPQSETIQYVLRFDSDEGLQPNNFVGRRRILHNGALGIILLAYMDEEFINKLLKAYPLEPHTPKTVTDQGVFLQRLKEIRVENVFIDEDETFIGYTAIAAPIFQGKNKAIASIAISGPSFKMEGERRIQLIEKIKKAAVKISMQMGQSLSKR
ncbi:IclR family transcriptional regulator [Alkalihalobacillus deserti]|uniref:IclR family transcriptional regulator n=1 Tax=Alkalihalobacillus deserti TaxID=2879466 RepID=UPI001D1336B3|nr:IclR family transcriptional regulator [Alkalihalobacillus deserti]